MGLSKDENDHTVLKSFVGTPQYIAPEIIVSKLRYLRTTTTPSRITLRTKNADTRRFTNPQNVQQPLPKHRITGLIIRIIRLMFRDVFRS